MIQIILQSFIKTSIWNLLWVSVLCAEILTAMMTSVLSLAWWGEVRIDLLLIGSIDALVVSFIVTIILISIFKYIKEIELKHQQQQIKARKLESVGVLAGGIAHDFNNILTAILGNISLSLLDKDLNVRTKNLLANAEKASLRAQGLTQQLLTFARGGEPVTETSSLDLVIRDSAGFVLSGAMVSCRYDIPDDLWMVKIDKGQISQVIQNIVLNASHATAGGGTILISCENVKATENEFPLVKKGRFVKITIEDSGVGIPVNVIEKIFDPYFSTKQDGSGLGLAITQSIISKHKGHLLVTSVSGSGTTFTIYLPAINQIEVHGQGLTRFEGRKAGKRKIKILAMDDEELLRDVAREMLTTLGHEVELAEDGEKAIKLYKEAMVLGDKFDLVILDLTVPGGMGGEDATREILACDSDAKVLVSSGYSNSPLMANYSDYGFCDAIVKPYNIQKLSGVIEKVLTLE